VKKKVLPKLTLNRETIQRLDDPALCWLAGGVGDPYSTKECPESPCGTAAPINAG